MDHIVIFGFFFNVLIGVWAVLYIHNIYKTYTYAFLQPITHYTVFYNCGVLVLLILLYLHINLPENFSPDRSPVYMDIFNLLVSLLIIGMIYSMRRIDLGFRDKDVSSRIHRAIVAGSLLLVASYCIKFALRWKRNGSR